MLTSGNKFFVIKSLREHEVIELALLLHKKNSLSLIDQLMKKCRMTTEEWFNSEL